MKYKVGDRFWHPLAKVEGEITEKVSKDIFKLEWEDGDKLIVSKKDLDDDIENKCISLISRKPKKKKNKLKKRVKELEKNLLDLGQRVTDLESSPAQNGIWTTTITEPKQETPNKKIINPDKKLEERLKKEIDCTIVVEDKDPWTLVRIREGAFPFSQFYNSGKRNNRKS